MAISRAIPTGSAPTNAPSAMCLRPSTAASSVRVEAGIRGMAPWKRRKRLSVDRPANTVSSTAPSWGPSSRTVSIGVVISGPLS